MKKLLFLSMMLFLLGIDLIAQEEPSPILFIYDASGSMWGQIDGKTKKEIASSVLSTTVNNLPENQHMGLIAYGHRTKGDCDDIESLVDLSNSSKSEVINAVEGINPIGRTPLARSATMAINALQSAQKKATIILITDGIESCGGDICQVVSDARANGITFKLHIVGFGLKEGEREQLKCAAEAGGGNYYDAGNTEGLSEGLAQATTETIDDPTGNFSVYAIKNNEPVDAWVKVIDPISKKTINGSRTYRDTGYVYVPPGSYEIEIQPLEGTDLSATTISVVMKEKERRHETVSFDSGVLNVTALNNNEGWDATVKVYRAGTKKDISRGRTYGRSLDLEVNPGVYDIFFQMLQIKGTNTNHTLEGIEVKANETKTISQNFETGVALIGVKTAGGDLIDATVNFNEQSSGVWVAGSRTYTTENNNPRKFILNPGVYEVKIVTLGAHKGHSATLSITVKTGETVEKILTF